MGYTVEKKNGSFCVINDSDGSTYKEFDTRREAMKELKVLMAIDPEEGKKDKKTGSDDEEGEYK